jgi:hypothetical protein
MKKLENHHSVLNTLAVVFASLQHVALAITYRGRMHLANTLNRRRMGELQPEPTAAPPALPAPPSPIDLHPVTGLPRPQHAPGEVTIVTGPAAAFRHYDPVRDANVAVMRATIAAADEDSLPAAVALLRYLQASYPHDVALVAHLATIEQLISKVRFVPYNQ